VTVTGTVGTCGGCAARWTAVRTAHCAACHRTFAGLTGFDRHRPAAGGCRDPRELGLRERPARGGAARGPVWASPDDGPAYWATRRNRRTSETAGGG
jgi:hypothetical protein